MSAPPGAAPWGRVIAIVVACSAAVAVVAWLIGSHLPETPGAPQGSSAGAQVPASHSSPSASDPHDLGVVPRKKPKPYHGRPKISVQYADISPGLCKPTFNAGINVVVVKGEVDTATAEVRIPMRKEVRPEALIGIAGEWSSTLYSLPTKQTVTLSVTAIGPEGKTEYTRDISHPCPGKAFNKTNPKILGTKQSRALMKQKMFAGHFHFDFKMSGRPTATPAPKPSHSPAATKR